MQHVSGLGPRGRPLATVAAGPVRWATSLPPLIPFVARRVLRGLAVLFVLSVDLC